MDSYLQQLQQTLAGAIRGMTIEELARHPTGKWSIGEELEHLYLTYTGTVKVFRRCLEAGKPLATRPTLKQRAMTTLIVECGYFPRGRKAPKQVIPKGMPAETVVAEIGPVIATMDELITQCEARHGARTKVLDHPILGPLTARQWRKFHWVHGRHHAKNITQRRKSAAEAGPGPIMP
jgi:hypothetical protein